jgi:hypothetical protein
MNNQPAKNWIDLGEWGKGMDEFKLPSSDELAGKELKLRFKGKDQIVKCVFYDARSLSWGANESLEKRPSLTETYEAIRIAPEIYFVDFVKNNKPNVSISMALDLSNSKATVITATAPEKGNYDFSFVNRLGQGVDLSAIKVEIQQAIIDPSSPDEPVPVHERTTELVGKRIQYTYGHDRVYEHIYLNNRFYTWHCLVGAEAGLGDTDVCDYFKIAPDIYLFSWREKIMPTYGLVIINLKEMRSNGKTFGLDMASGKCINFTMGAVVEFLNETKYPKKGNLR